MMMFGRFQTYLELGRLRAVRAAHEMINALGQKVSLGQMYQVSYFFRWLERAQAFDVDQDRLERERIMLQRREMAERHRKVGTALQAKALTRLKDLPVQDLSSVDVTRMIRLGVDIERVAVGEPDTTVAVTGPSGGPLSIEDMSQYTPEQRRARLEEIATELARRSAGAFDDPDAED